MVGKPHHSSVEISDGGERRRRDTDLERWWFAMSATIETLGTSLLTRYEYKVIDTGNTSRRSWQ